MIGIERGLAELREALEREKLPQALIASFSRQYRRYREGELGKLPWAEIEPAAAADIIDREGLPPVAEERRVELLDQLVSIRLNGGLGTSMMLSGAKSLIPVRGGKSFLQLAREQIEALRRSSGARLPLVLMNSFNTRSDSLAALDGFEQPDGLPLDFLQHKVPRIDAATGGATRFPEAADNWAPPGHGDIYLALQLSGLLDRLLEAGYRWAFVANIDNLAATADVEILAFLADQGLEFAMEVTDKTLADVKGGTLVRYRDRLTLLERAQVEPAHLADFENIDELTVFNTNNLWWNLSAVRDRLAEGRLELPLIVNPKQEAGRAFVQLETAMGAAVGSFDRAIGLRVPRRRFAPVKTTDDLLAVRSDAFELDAEGGLRLVESRRRPPVVKLDTRYYRSIGDFERRVPHPLGLIACDALKVEGDVRFGAGVEVHGQVALRRRRPGAATVEDGTVFDGGTHDL